MPWTNKDVDRFRSGLDEKQKAAWVAIANGSLEACKRKNDSDILECETNAVKTANSRFASLSDIIPPHLAPPVNPSINEGQISDWQLVLSIGAHQTMSYDELIITRTFCERLVYNWQSKVMNNRDPFLDVEHDQGEAQAWIEDMRCTDDGLEVRFRWTEPGREKVLGELYRMYSAHFGPAKDIKTGEIVYPVLYGVALTNKPVLNTLPKAQLSEKYAQGDGPKESHGEKIMTIKDVLAFIADPARTDEEKAEIMKALGMDVPEKKVEVEAEADANKSGDAEKKEAPTLSEKASVLMDALKDQVKSLSDKLESRIKADDDARKNSVIQKALSEGRIKPVDQAKWEGRYDVDPAGIAGILSELPADPNFKVAGIAKGKMADVNLSDKDLEMARAWGQEKEVLEGKGE